VDEDAFMFKHDLEADAMGSVKRQLDRK